MYRLKHFKLFGWTGLAALVASILGDLHSTPADFLKYAVNECWRMIYILPFNWLIYEWIWPRLSFKHIIRSLSWSMAIALITIFGLYTWRYLGIAAGIYTSFMTNKSISHILADQLGSTVGSLFFFGIVRHIYLHIMLKQTAQQLRIEKQAAELNYLKAQTNPHFLFNTLNNIYSLSRDKSDLAPESILRLSKILRYMLYETGGDFIAIADEIKIITDYLALEKLRYDDSLNIRFTQDIENMQQSLPPLLLVPLVENAFKHGVSETRHLPFVHIHLSVGKRQLALVVKNSSPAITENRENIGLSNLRRQLELQYTDFTLEHHREPGSYTASLTINLSSHV